jgi:hypothetical protein
LIVLLRDTSGTAVYMEVSDEVMPGDDILRAQLTPEDRLEQLGIAVASTCRSIVDQVRAQVEDAMPDQFEVSFGVKLAGEVGLPIVAKSSAEATLNIRAVWTRSS